MYGILISFEVEEEMEIEQYLELLSPHGQWTQPQINFLVFQLSVSLKRLYAFRAGLCLF